MWFEATTLYIYANFIAPVPITFTSSAAFSPPLSESTRLSGTSTYGLVPAIFTTLNTTTYKPRHRTGRSLTSQPMTAAARKTLTCRGNASTGSRSTRPKNSGRTTSRKGRSISPSLCCRRSCSPASSSSCTIWSWNVGSVWC